MGDRDASDAAADVEELRASAQRASARGDDALAAEILSRAIRSLPDDDPRVPAILRDLGVALVGIGRIDDGESALRRAAELAHGMGDRSLEWSALLELNESRMQSDPEGSYDRAFDQAGRAMQWFTAAGDDRGLARSWELIAGTLYFRGEVALAELALNRALEHARVIDDRRQIHRLVLHGVNAALEGPRHVEDATRRCLAAVAELQDDDLGQGVTLLNLATLHAYTGAFDEATEFLARAKATLSAVGTPYAVVAVAQEGGRLEMLRGDPVAAEAAYREGRDALEELGEKSYRSILAAYIARALLDQERFDEAERSVDESQTAGAMDDITTQISWRSARALLAARDGDTAEAIRLASEAVQLAERTDYLAFQAGAWMDLARVLATAGSRGRTVQAAREALSRYERKGITVLAERARAFLAAHSDAPLAGTPL